MRHENKEGLLLPRVGLRATAAPAPDHDEILYWKFSPHLSLQDLFRTAVEQYATKTAVVMGKDQISFAALDQVSNQLAHYLTTNGIGKGDLVPVWMERSIDLIIALIAVQKTGAAYIPVDASYPEKRVEAIIADSGARLVVTVTTLSSRLPDNINCVNTDDKTIKEQPATPLNRLPSSGDLAYVIYTSGSTGQPKGVMVTHQAIQHLVSWHAMHFNVHPSSKLSYVAGVSFDISVWEIWTALTSGATLYIAREEERTDASQLLKYYEQNQITHGFVPTVLAPEVVEGSKSRTLALSYLFTAGEKLKPVNTEGLSYTLIDYYGPTECTVFATFQVVNRPDGKYISSIGHPIAHTQAYILDTRMVSVAGNNIGELYIGGACLAAGYWKNEQLTRERFIPSPFHPGQKLYRTGDLARWLPDGSLAFLGRSDNQVKIRGYRIELGEIEHQLLQLPFVQNAIVLPRENSKQQKQLAAIIQLKQSALLVPGNNSTVQTIREHIKQQLPGYMMPAYFIFKDSFPVNINGKVNMQQLKDHLEQEKLTPEANTPRGDSDMERCIIEVWTALLEHDTFDTSDDFFDIGGNSLLVAAAAVDIAASMKVKVYLRDIYQYPTVKSLAATLTERMHSLSAIPAEDTEPVIELQNDVYLEPGTTFSTGFDPAVLANQAHIMLTGVSGLIGIHLLEELLLHTQAEVYCLIRARNEYDALLKIDETARRFKVELRTELKKRIIPVPGDLTLPDLGLPTGQYEKLSGLIQVIYHSASSVNFIEPYSYNKAANVEGLRRLIRFAGHKQLKCLSLMSTISVYSWGHKFTGKTVMTEQDDIQQNILSVSKDIGYVRSKYVMEAIADLAASQGLPVMTYRLGYALCHGRTGACATYQWWSNLIKVCLKYNAYPDLVELREGLITVDYMTQSVVHITQQPDAIGKKFNLIASPENNLTLQQFFDLLHAYYPINLKKVSYREWRGNWENDPSCILYPLTSLFKDNMHEGLSTIELYQNTYAWDNRQVKEKLKNSMIQEPVFNKELLDNYMAYLGITFPEVV